MNVQQTAKTKGFTIIEVVLVLAIAGLIFLMVFIALPALQRNQRDTQRRDDISRFISQVQSYSTNNNGKVPDSAKLDSFKTSYLKWAAAADDSEYNDPQTGEPYSITFKSGATDGAVQPSEGSIFYHASAKCSGENAVAAGTRQVAVRVRLEGSGVFCQSNQ